MAKTIRMGFIVEEVFKDKVKMKCLKKKVTMSEIIVLLLSRWLKEQ